MEFVRLCRSGQVPDDTVRRFFVNDVEFAVTRWEGDIYITSNYCTHLDCLLSSGRVVEDGLMCSCHNSVFDLESGEPIQPPATKPLRVYESEERDGEVFVKLDAEALANEGPHRRRQFEASEAQRKASAPATAAEG
ncbi:MAG TPA: Rieske (2Fe-2S) protein [Actinomycetales bacterium]|nr:Rieske (2Fe-2S) protein [Actinomycetales bacterium]